MTSFRSRRSMPNAAIIARDLTRPRDVPGEGYGSLSDFTSFSSAFGPPASSGRRSKGELSRPRKGRAFFEASERAVDNDRRETTPAFDSAVQSNHRIRGVLSAGSR